MNPDFDMLRSRFRFRFALSQMQMQELIEVAGAYNDTHELMISMQVYTGCRVGEVVNLEISDLFIGDPASSEIWIRAKVEDDGKGNTRLKWVPKTEAGNRRIPVPADTAKQLKRFLGKYRRKKGYVFVSNKRGNGQELKNKKYREDTVIHFIDKYANECKTIGHNIGSHALRRTYASVLISEGIPIGLVSKNLGHASIEITMRYLFAVESPDDGAMVQ